MSDYDNTDTGVLFKARNKKSDRHPDYTGKINVAGKDMRLAAWIKDGRSGKFLSIKVSDYQVNGEGKPAPNREAPADDLDDDIPF
jgi:hypothetical protein